MSEMQPQACVSVLFCSVQVITISEALLWAERRCWQMLAVQALWLTSGPGGVMKFNAAEETTGNTGRVS